MRRGDAGRVDCTSNTRKTIELGPGQGRSLQGERGGEGKETLQLRLRKGVKVVELKIKILQPPMKQAT